MPPHSRIIRFYLGSAPDYEGRKIGDIWKWTRPEIDASPSAFNWLFPIPFVRFRSGCMPLFGDDIVIFKSHPMLQAHARKSYAWFTGIIGLSLEDNGSITKGALFLENFDVENPLTKRRIQRVLRFLTTIGMGADARTLLAWLEAEAASEGSRLPQTLVAYWRKGIEPDTASGADVDHDATIPQG